MRISPDIEAKLKDISMEEWNRLNSFLQTHHIKSLPFEDRTLQYYSCGKGDKVILTFGGGIGSPALQYEKILQFESTYRIIVFNLDHFRQLSDFKTAVNRVLDEEGIEHVILIGQSMTGIIAQAYLKRSADRVKAMILINTLAPVAGRNKKWAIPVFRMLPGAFISFLFKKKLRRLSQFQHEIPEEAASRLRFRSVAMGEFFSNHLDKKSILNLLEMAMEHNRMDDYSENPPVNWKGNTLIVTSEDDAGYKDLNSMKSAFPQAEVFILPTGYGHEAPAVLAPELYSRIKLFLVSV